MIPSCRTYFCGLLMLYQRNKPFVTIDDRDRHVSRLWDQFNAAIKTSQKLHLDHAMVQKLLNCFPVP